MSTRRDHIDLAKHMEWADSLVWATTLQSGPARADDRLRTWLHHLHTVQRAFTATWRGEPIAFVDVSTFADPPALAAWGRAAHSGVQTFLAGADDATLDRQLVMPWANTFVPSGSSPTHPSIRQTVWQLSLHSAHHRGQVNARLRDLGAEPPLVDFIAWIWRGQPAPAWPRNVGAPAAPST